MGVVRGSVIFNVKRILLGYSDIERRDVWAMCHAWDR